MITNKVVMLIYASMNLGVFSYAVFKLNYSPWFFVLMVFMDIMFNHYQKNTA